jgi:hypothetical protein
LSTVDRDAPRAVPPGNIAIARWPCSIDMQWPASKGATRYGAEFVRTGLAYNSRVWFGGNSGWWQ